MPMPSSSPLGSGREHSVTLEDSGHQLVLRPIPDSEPLTS